MLFRCTLVAQRNLLTLAIAGRSSVADIAHQEHASMQAVGARFTDELQCRKLLIFRPLVLDRQLL